MEKDFNNLGKEKDDGNIEYKLRLCSLDESRVEELITQMNYRLIEGNGEAIYEIGIKDDGFPSGIALSEFDESYSNLVLIAKQCNAKCKIISKKEISKNKFVAEIIVRQKLSNKSFIDVSIVVAGNVDAGKSSTIGVLISNTLDNGRGKTRSHVFNFKHEMQSGRTSSIAHQILGYDSEGNPINDNLVKKMSWPDIVRESSKIVTFYDLAGHEKYLRTTIYGFSSTCPDYSMVLIGANMGITHMTKEHIALCLSYKIPFFIVFTKIDIAPESVYEETKKRLKTLIKTPGIRKMMINMKNDEDIVLAAKNITNNNVVPVIEISNVSGHNIDLLKRFLNLLPQRKNFKVYEDNPVEFSIDEKYNVTGVGTVVAGVLHRGTIKLNDSLLVGPDSSGNYRNTVVKSIHFKRVPIEEAKAGSYVCLNIKKIPKTWIRRGMAVISKLDQPRTVWEFKAVVSILKTHHTTINLGYEPTIHINNISQACKILKIENKKDRNDLDEITNDKILRAGDKALIHFKFKYRPEYISEGNRIVFRENKVRGIGVIKDISHNL